MKIRCFFIVISAVFLNFSCTHDGIVSIDEIETICFEEQILPIFQTGCAISSCHSIESAEDGYIYSDYQNIMHSIVQGSPFESKAYQTIIAKRGENTMPPDSPLTEKERTLIRIWIEQGAQETFCNDNGKEFPADSLICFTSEVLPIMLSSCSTTGCHDEGSHKEGLVLNTYTNIFESNEEGLIVSGNPEGSEIYQVLNKSGEDRMPPYPNEPLTGNQIQIIYDWIKEGANNLECEENCDPSEFTFQLTISSLIENNCRGCHNGDSPSGGVLLNSYSDIKTIAENGLLMDVVKGLNGKSLMPPSNPLDNCQIEQLENWILNGSLNN